MNGTIEDFIGNTPLVRLQRLNSGFEKNKNIILAKLEGNNPAGSVKDRPALSMIKHAERRGTIKPGDTLIEATSGNTGIALAMAAAIKGYRMVLIMPEHMSVERRAVMKAFGAEIVLVSQKSGMEGARNSRPHGGSCCHGETLRWHGHCFDNLLDDILAADARKARGSAPGADARSRS